MMTSPTLLKIPYSNPQWLIDDLTITTEAIDQLHHQYNTMMSSNGCMDSVVKCFFEQKAKIVSKLRYLIDMYEQFYEEVINVQIHYRRQQALAGNGATLNESILDHIEWCYGSLEKLVSGLLHAVEKIAMVTSGKDFELTQVEVKIKCALKNLLCSAFIVDEQPPQVMKTNTRFSASVRWLLSEHLEMHKSPPVVDCLIISETEAQMLVCLGADRNLPERSSGVITNNSSSMTYQRKHRVFSANFRNMQLKKIRRGEKKGTESVMEQKFALCFYCTTQVGKYQIFVWTLSLPVVVIAHSIQEPLSWATITWDNAFQEIVRDPFLVTDYVSWAKLSIALNLKFGSATQRPLTDDNLDFIHEKLLRKNALTDCITWNQFCKETVPHCTFTFWEWFYAIMKLVKDFILKMWTAGRIVGFITKERAREILSNSDTGVGTFLIRFSESELGGVTIAFVNSFGSVSNLEPWTARDLNTLSLANRIRDLDQLRFLYPTDRNSHPLERDFAFNEFYTPATMAKFDCFPQNPCHIRMTYKKS